MGQSCVKGALVRRPSKGKPVKIPAPGRGNDGNVCEPGDAGGGAPDAAELRRSTVRWALSPDDPIPGPSGR